MVKTPSEWQIINGSAMRKRRFCAENSFFVLVLIFVFFSRCSCCWCWTSSNPTGAPVFRRRHQSARTASSFLLFGGAQTHPTVTVRAGRGIRSLVSFLAPEQQALRAKDDEGRDEDPAAQKQQQQQQSSERLDLEDGVDAGDDDASSLHRALRQRVAALEEGIGKRFVCRTQIGFLNVHEEPGDPFRTDNVVGRLVDGDIVALTGPPRGDWIQHDFGGWSIAVHGGFVWLQELKD